MGQILMFRQQKSADPFNMETTTATATARCLHTHVVAVVFSILVSFLRLDVVHSISVPKIDATAWKDSKQQHKQKQQQHQKSPFVITNAIPESDRKQWWKHIQTRSTREHVQVRTITKRGTGSGDYDDNDDDDDDEESLESYELQDALRFMAKPQLSATSIYISSVGSSCSTDQLPNFRDAFFSPNNNNNDGDNENDDLLALFSPYTPIHDTLSLSSGKHATSTLCCRAYTSVILHLAGQPGIGSTVEWKFCKSGGGGGGGGGPATTTTTQQEDNNNNQQQQQQRRRRDDLFSEYSSYRAVTRTWNGAEFSMGSNSPESMFDDDTGRWDHLVDTAATKTMITTTTRPGDLLIIPPFWWYQNRAGRLPNVLIHSKRCGKAEFPSLVRCILATVKKDDTNGDNLNTMTRPPFVFPEDYGNDGQSTTSSTGSVIGSSAPPAKDIIQQLFGYIEGQ